tara:strand:+ start:2082 stop:2564 length:483 start_codon:yes stop_codon:yes gene_type:complete
MSKQLNKKFIFSLFIFISLVLIFAFIIQYQLGHQACTLCLYERIPYFLAVFLLAIIFIFKKYEKITLLVLSSIFICSSILAFYHFGIEKGFFQESLACTTGDVLGTFTKEQLLEQLNQNTIGCKDVSFKILGLSLASINIIFSIALSVIFAKLFINYGKN